MVAEIVAVMGVTHNPLMWSLLRDSPPPDLEAVRSNFDHLKATIAELEPEVIVLVASDHQHMLVTANMPAFMIGKADLMRAVFDSEVRSFGMEPTTVRGDHGLATHLLGGESLPLGFDFAFSDEPWLDHAFMVPLLMLTPELDIPVVPVFTNTTSPPIASASRFAHLGRHIRQQVDTWDGASRVLVVGSGHLAHELGGPRHFLGVSPDQGFDEEAVRWLSDGDLAAAVAGSSFERLTKAGNETYQFLDFITCLAAAGAAPATMAEATPTRFGNLPFFLWEPK